MFKQTRLYSGPPPNRIVVEGGVFKICARCERARFLSGFWTYSTQTHRKPYSFCKDCSKTYQREWFLRNRAKQRKYSRRAKLKEYNISEEEYRVLHDAQMGACAICSGTETTRLAIDHDPIDGRIRGLLCKACNLGLGSLRHEPELLRRAAVYLEKCRP